MIIDLTRPKPKQPYHSLTRTVVYIPAGILTSLNVHLWEKRTGLEFDWHRVISGGESEYDVMADIEFDAIPAFFYVCHQFPRSFA